MNLTFNKEQFEGFYNNPEITWEQFAQELTEQYQTKVSVATVKNACKFLGLNPKNRNRKARVTFSFETSNITEQVETMQG